MEAASPAPMPDLDTLAPGVEGFEMVNEEGVVYFSLVMATNPGSGAVGCWLDSLPTDKTYRIPGVLNPRLAGMLERRGWKINSEYAPEFGEDVQLFERVAEPPKPDPYAKAYGGSE